MRKTLMIVAIAVAGLLVIAIVLALASGWLSERKRTRVIELKVTSVPFVSDAAAALSPSSGSTNAGNQTGQHVGGEVELRE